MSRGQWDGSEGFRNGNPRREFPTIPLFNLDPSTPDIRTNIAARLLLTNLVGNLKLHVGVGIIQDNSSKRFPWPVGGGTIQLTPFNQYGDTDGKTFLRPIFQDPTFTDNANHPLPEELPFGWEGPFTLASGLLIEVTINPTAFSSVPIALGGTVVCQVAIEYNGAWWDVASWTYSLSSPQLQGVSNPISFGTGGGG